MNYRFSSATMKRVAARAAASDNTSKLERRLGAGLLAVAPRRSKRSDALVALDEAIRKAGYAPRRKLTLKRRRDLTDAEKLERYRERVARLYRQRWTLPKK